MQFSFLVKNILQFASFANLKLISGDLIDEGKWSTREEFFTYADRFYSLFGADDKVKLYAIVGNHDVGFHYAYVKNSTKMWIS